MSDTARFVGREQELAELDAALHDAFGGRRKVILLSGEPGIGKTRLATEAARRAEAAGARCAWGRATEDDGSPPYWPFRQAARALAGSGPVPELLDGGAELGAADRFLAFEDAARFLATASAEHGLLLVLDDLQWADPSSLSLLVHLARGADPARLAVIATYRDTETAGRDALRHALGELAREPALTRMRLVGLTEPQIAQRLADLTGAMPAADVLATVNRRTHGNPFFVQELGRVLASGSTGLPDGVRDALRARLARLSEPAQTVVGDAAVLGATFDTTALTAVCDGPVLAALDELATAGVLVAGPPWAFAHDLIREVAVQDVPTPRRLTVHRRMAEYLESRADAGQRAMEIAEHWWAGLSGDSDDAQRAALWAERAARRAESQLAWDEAISWYTRALTVVSGPQFTAGDRCRLLLARARTQVTAFDLVGVEGSLSEAARIARDEGDADALARAALTLEGLTDRVWGPISRQLCEEALAALPTDDSQQRARLLAQLAADCVVTGAADRSDALSAEGLAIAERLGDPATLAAALRGRQFACAGPDGTPERVALGDRMLELAAAHGEAEAELWGRLWRFDALVQLGETPRAEAELAPLDAVATRLGRPFARWHVLRSRAALAFGQGRLDEAHALGEQAARIGEQHNWPGDVHPSDLFRAYVCVLRGDELPTLRPGAQWPPFVLAFYYCEIGRFEKARPFWPGVEALTGVIPTIALGGLTSAALLAAAFDDREAAAEIYRRAQPFGDRVICGGAGAFAVFGSMHRTLGVVAGTLGRLDDAARHLRDAIAANDRGGWQPWAAHSRHDLATVLARRRRPGDVEEAAALTAAAGAAAERLGMRPLAGQARELAARLAGGAGPVTRREREVAQLVAQGLTNRQISATLHISERTAENHVQHILTKLGFTTRTQIATWMSTASE